MSEEVGARKPDRAFFAAVEAAGFPVARAVMLGDQPLVDIHGGKRAGMTAAWINRRAETYPQELLPPDFEAADLVEAIRHIQQQAGLP